MEDDTDDEDEAPRNDGGSSTEPVSEIASDDGTEECTSRENRRNEGLLPIREGESVLLCVCRVGREVRKALVEVDEVLHAHDSGNISRVVAKEDTTKRGKGAHEVRLDRHRGLNPVHVRGCDKIMACHDGERVQLHGYLVGMFEGMFGSKNIGGSVVVVDDAEEMSRPTDRGCVCLWEGKVHGRGRSSSDRSRVQNTRAGEASCTLTGRQDYFK